MIWPVGNDVVDLHDLQSQPGAIHPRWDSRVFVVEELERLADSPCPHRARWAMWAAKESSFKAARKLEPTLSFFPLSFVVELRHTADAGVRHAMGSFDVRLYVTDDCVHATSVPAGSPPPSFELGVVESVSQPVGLASVQVRDLARRAISTVMDRDPSDIEIEASDGVPIAIASGVALPVDLSLSHHGRFLACAWLSRPETEEGCATPLRAE